MSLIKRRKLCTSLSTINHAYVYISHNQAVKQNMKSEMQPIGNVDKVLHNT